MRVIARYDEQFKQSAVELLAHTDRSFEQVAADLGVSQWCLRDWYKKRMPQQKLKGRAAVVAPPTGESADEQLRRLERENACLRKENESLKIDREILKKAAAFFAKESA